MHRQGTTDAREVITHDTGFINAGASTREPFDPEVEKREMCVIHDDLHCNAVPVSGGDLQPVGIAATHAAETGLEVWFSPLTGDLTPDEVLDLLADCATHAARLRCQQDDVIVTGAELSLFTKGFLLDVTPAGAGPHRGPPAIRPGMSVLTEVHAVS